MNTNPMVQEVNRLVGDLLAGGERLLLPGIGSLMTVTRPARRLSKSEVKPPMRVVEFHGEELGLSLVDRIAVAAACTPEESEEVYARWKGHTLAEGVLTIEGVGVVKQDHFKAEPSFEQRLNPEGVAPIRVKRRSRFDWTFVVGIIAILIALGIGWYGYRLMQEKPVRTVEPIQRTERPAPEKDTTAVTAVEPTAAATPQSGAVATPVTQPAAPADGVQRMTSGWYYVVLGVFSTEENARRAAADAAAKSDVLACTIYYFGQKWMVSPCGVADSEEANAFRKAHAATYPDLWVYRAK